MRTYKGTISLAVLALLGACSRGHEASPDDALKSDLALAAQVQPYQAQQFVSPNEQQLAAQQGRTPVRAAPSVSRAPVRRAPVRSASRSTGSSGGSYPSVPREPERHTQRDAAIGAAAGAVIGATTSRDKIKGGIIGAAAGGILGGIIGHTVDVKNPQ